MLKKRSNCLLELNRSAGRQIDSISDNKIQAVRQVNFERRELKV
jgi:hypothetical protein